MIEIRDLTKTFEEHLVLNGVNLTINKGETMVIIGRSGCGKSVLLKHLIGLMKPDRGEVRIDGLDVTGLSGAELDAVRLKMGMLFQGAALFDSMTVEDNVGFALREHARMEQPAIAQRVTECLSLVGLSGVGDLRPSELSGGMRKRVGLARAIALDPEIIFYDEPTAGLDPIVSGVIDKLILDLSKKLSITSVVVTHDMKSVFSIADRVAMLYEGRVLEVGTPHEIKTSANPSVRQFISGSPDGPIRFFQQKDDYLEHLMK